MVVRSYTAAESDRTGYACPPGGGGLTNHRPGLECGVGAGRHYVLVRLYTAAESDRMGYACPPGVVGL